MIETYDPNNVTQYEDISPVLAVIDAWTVAWPDAAWQEECRGEVHKLMPALARSLDRLVEPENQYDAACGVEPSIEALGLRRTQLLAELAQVEDGLQKFMKQHRDDGALQAEVLAASALLADREHPLEEEEAEPDYSVLSIEEAAARGRRATERLRIWGRGAVHKRQTANESAVRERIIVWLNNRDGLTQQAIGEMLGVGGARISQIVAAYYNRLEQQNQDVRH